MRTVFLYKWNPLSVGGANICRTLPAKSILHENSKFVGSPDKTVINWGASNVPSEVLKCRVLNRPEAVAETANKLLFFQKIASVARAPEFTTDLDKALEWVKSGKEVLARTLLSSSSGKGIVFFNEVEEFSKGKLFVQYKKKKAEYRVHVVLGEVVLVQKKALRTHDDDGTPIDPKLIDFRIQNLQNGFIFKRNDVVAPEDVITQALRAYEASGLDFAAFDVIWNEHERQAYVLEANTAPGLEGSSIFDYSNRFAREFGFPEKEAPQENAA